SQEQVAKIAAGCRQNEEHQGSKQAKNRQLGRIMIEARRVPSRPGHQLEGGWQDFRMLPNQLLGYWRQGFRACFHGDSSLQSPENLNAGFVKVEACEQFVVGNEVGQL